MDAKATESESLPERRHGVSHAVGHKYVDITGEISWVDTVSQGRGSGRSQSPASGVWSRSEAVPLTAPNAPLFAGPDRMLPELRA